MSKVFILYLFYPLLLQTCRGGGAHAHTHTCCCACRDEDKACGKHSLLLPLFTGVQRTELRPSGFRSKCFIHRATSLSPNPRSQCQSGQVTTKLKGHSSSQLTGYETNRETQPSLLHSPVTIHISKYELCALEMKHKRTRPPQRTLYSSYTKGQANSTFQRFLKLQQSLHSHSQICNMRTFYQPNTTSTMKGDVSPTDHISCTYFGSFK